MKRRILTLVLVVAAAIAVDVLPVGAARFPRTMARSTPVGAAPVEPGFPIDVVGVHWTGGPAEGAIRFRHGSQWGAWLALVEGDVAPAGGWASALMAAGDADAYQLRLPGGTHHPRAVAINTTDGPGGGSEPSSAAEATAVNLTRGQWGADESLRFDSNGTEVWPPTYYPVQKLTVHHTATANGDADPAATVRAIYHYHAVELGYGDIGYQLLIDESGRVYEGRWSGTDGDPGHDAAGKGVTAAHVGGMNSGNLGVALLGTLTDRGPAAAARAALETLLRDLTTRHAIAPEGSGSYVNPANGATWTGPNIPGHRDWAPTECPGGALYSLLPDIRRAVAGSGTTDTQAPVISGVSARSVTASGATIRWTTNEPADSQVEYWPASQPSAVRVTPADTSLVTSHEVVLTGLTRRTKFKYRVRSADAAGNLAVSPTYAFTTKR